MSRMNASYALVAAVGALGFVAGSMLSPEAMRLSTVFAKADDPAQPRPVTPRSVPLTRAELAAADDLFHRPQHPYTVSLLAAVPVPIPRSRNARNVNPVMEA